MRKKLILIHSLLLCLSFLPALHSQRGSQSLPSDSDIYLDEKEDSRKLPWPHQRPDMAPDEIKQLIKNIWVFDNFGSCHESEDQKYFYCHDGLDIMLPNGTKIYAIKSGYVKSARNDWTTYGCINIGDMAGDSPGWGWEYGHVINFQVEEGEYVHLGDYIADVTLNHIHLSRIHVSEGDWGEKKNLEYYHPDKYFTYEDTIPPQIAAPFFYFRNNSNEAFEDGSPIKVRGDVDIVVPIRDSSEVALNGPLHYPWSITRIEFEIIGGHSVQPVQMRSVDLTKMFFADWPGVYEQFAFAIYKPRFLPVIQKRGWNNQYLFYNVTNTDGSGELGQVKYAWEEYAWNTTAMDESGNRLFPDGDYTIKVTAYDFKGNPATALDVVAVCNNKKSMRRR